MTVRGYLIRRQAVASVIGTVTCVVLALAFLWLIGPASQLSSYAILAFIVVVMPVQWLIRSRLVRCPRCNTSLGARGIGSRRQCPKCGLDFNEPWPPAP
jgi:hypothetical protein